MGRPTWTADQFHHLGELGVLEGRRAILVDGALLEEGTASPPHAVCLELASEVLRAAFGAGWRVRVRMPLVLGPTTDPEPDLALVAGSARGTTAHPTHAALVVEVSDASLRYDTTVKQSLYAAAGIADSWVLDVPGRRLLVFRDPRPDPSQPHGHGYATQATHAPGAAVQPLAVPAAAIQVQDLLP